jgi:hypothetical protein
MGGEGSGHIAFPFTRDTEINLPRYLPSVSLSELQKHGILLHPDLGLREIFL